VAGAEAAFWLGPGVKRGADVIPAAASVENHQSWHLCGQFGFALLDEELPKLRSERGEHVSERHSFFSLLVHGVLLSPILKSVVTKFGSQLPFNWLQSILNDSREAGIGVNIGVSHELFR